MIKELPKEFIGKGEVRGYQFFQLAASEKGYLYQVTRGAGGIHYEIFKRVMSKAHKRIAGGKVVAEHPDEIIYPTGERFSKYACTYSNFEKACASYNRLCNTPDGEKWLK